MCNDIINLLFTNFVFVPLSYSLACCLPHQNAISVLSHRAVMESENLRTETAVLERASGEEQ